MITHFAKLESVQGLVPIFGSFDTQTRRWSVPRWLIVMLRGSLLKGEPERRVSP